MLESRARFANLKVKMPMILYFAKMKMRIQTYSKTRIMSCHCHYLHCERRLHFLYGCIFVIFILYKPFEKILYIHFIHSFIHLFPFLFPKLRDNGNDDGYKRSQGNQRSANGWIGRLEPMVWTAIGNMRQGIEFLLVGNVKTICIRWCCSWVFFVSVSVWLAQLPIQWVM